MAESARRSGDETRAEILRVAFDLFTDQGFEGTSIKDIADALGVTKSSLYYHFANKEDIILSLVVARRDELDALHDWILAEPQTSDLLARAALRWIDSSTPERLQGMRFARANQPTMNRLATTRNDIRAGFDRIVDLFVEPEGPIESRLFVKLTFDTINAALFAAEGTNASPAEILDTARRAVRALTAGEFNTLPR